MASTILLALVALTQGINISIIWWFVGKKELLVINKTTNKIDTRGDYAVARAIILQHIIDDWDKGRWLNELHALDERCNKTGDEE